MDGSTLDFRDGSQGCMPWQETGRPPASERAHFRIREPRKAGMKKKSKHEIVVCTHSVREGSDLIRLGGFSEQQSMSGCVEPGS